MIPEARNTGPDGVAREIANGHLRPARTNGRALRTFLCDCCGLPVHPTQAMTDPQPDALPALIEEKRSLEQQRNAVTNPVERKKIIQKIASITAKIDQITGQKTLF